MSVTVRWFGDDVTRYVMAQTEKGLDKLSETITEDVREAMRRTPRKGDDARSTYASGKRAGQRKGRDRRPSQDYHAPAVQKGVLLRSYQWVRQGKLRRRVGSNLKYALYLEVGTKHINERPALRPALYKHTGQTGEEIIASLF